jgi:hypothetical protein
MFIFQQLLKSLYSTKHISSFRFQKIGKPILYVFFLSLISILPNGIYFGIHFSNGINEIIKVVETKIPDFSIKEGTLYSSLDKPVEYQAEHFKILFDSSGSITQQDLQPEEETVALLQNEIVVSFNQQVQTIEYTLFKESDYNKNDVLSFLYHAKQVMPIFISVFLLLMYLIASGSKFIEISILAMIGLLFKNGLSRNVNYRHLWILSVYSVTITTIFFTVMDALQTTVPLDFYINWIVNMFILYLAIKEIPSNKKSIH